MRQRLIIAGDEVQDSSCDACDGSFEMVFREASDRSLSRNGVGNRRAVLERLDASILPPVDDALGNQASQHRSHSGVANFPRNLGEDCVGGQGVVAVNQRCDFSFAWRKALHVYR